MYKFLFVLVKSFFSLYIKVSFATSLNHDYVRLSQLDVRTSKARLAAVNNGKKLKPRPKYTTLSQALNPIFFHSSWKIPWSQLYIKSIIIIIINSEYQ